MPSGSGASLRRLASRVRNLNTVPSRVSTAYATWAQAEVLRAYDEERSVQGTPWAPPSDTSIIAWGWVPPLGVESGAMRGTVRAYALSGAGIRVEYGGRQYMADFFSGRTGRPPGQFQPARPLFGRGSLPTEWTDELRRRIREEWDL